MSQLSLIVDGDNLCHTSYHATKPMENGAIFGFFQKVEILKERFGTNNVIFCFDSNPSSREKEYPFYKSERRARWHDPIERDKLMEIKRQKHLIQHDWLRWLGYVNIFSQEGYEADDLIAVISESIIRNKIRGDGQAVQKVIIASSDKDLYQLLADTRILVYSLGTNILWDEYRFREKFKAAPDKWPRMKALMGDATDGITGVHQVGEATAAKYVNRTLNISSKAYNECKSFVATEAYQANLRLVSLPWPGTKTPKLKLQQPIDRKRWHEFCVKLNFQRLLNY